MNIYQQQGYESRTEYLQSVAEDFGCSLGTVLQIAQVLGPSEDFDGLITNLEDYLDMMDDYEF